LPDNVKEVFVDLTYRGDYTGSDDKRGNTRKVIVPAVYKDQQDNLSGDESDFYQVMTDKGLWRVDFKVDPNRVKKRYKELE
jgi:hypothetical protein